MRIAPDQLLDPLKLRTVGQVRRLDGDVDAILFPQPAGERLKPLEVPRNKHKVVPTLRKTLGIDRADTRGSAGDEDSVFRGGRGHGWFPLPL